MHVLEQDRCTPSWQAGVALQRPTQHNLSNLVAILTRRITIYTRMTNHDAVWKSFAIIPKVGGTLSCIGSTLIVRDIVKKYRNKKSVALTSTMMLSISVANIVGSFFGYVMSTWMVPRGDAFYAAGNLATCEAQGFIVTWNLVYFVTSYAMLSALCKLAWLRACSYWCHYLIPSPFHIHSHADTDAALPPFIFYLTV